MKYLIVFLTVVFSFDLYGQSQIKIHSISTIDPITERQRKKWNHVENKQLGIMGSDFNERYQIGTAPVERPANFGPVNYSRINFWYPNKRPEDNGKAYKQTMIGSNISRAERYNNTQVFPDFDIDFYIKPDPFYSFLISQNPRPNSNYKSLIGDVAGGDLPNCPASFTKVEAET